MVQSRLSCTLYPTQLYDERQRRYRYIFHPTVNSNTLPAPPALLRGHAKFPGPHGIWGRRHALGRTESHSEEERQGEWGEHAE